MEIAPGRELGETVLQPEGGRKALLTRWHWSLVMKLQQVSSEYGSKRGDNAQQRHGWENSMEMCQHPDEEDSSAPLEAVSCKFCIFYM